VNPVFDAIDVSNTKQSATAQLDHGEDAKPRSKNQIDRSTDRIDEPTLDEDDMSTIEAKKRKLRR
jgi:hypothetical protein